MLELAGNVILCFSFIWGPTVSPSLLVLTRIKCFRLQLYLLRLLLILLFINPPTFSSWPNVTVFFFCDVLRRFHASFVWKHA